MRTPWTTAVPEATYSHAHAQASNLDAIHHPDQHPHPEHHAIPNIDMDADADADSHPDPE
jgi:hypothetical protein